MKKIATFLCIPTLVISCNTLPTNNSDQNKGFPGNSIATFSTYLHNDATRSLKTWVKQKLTCDYYKVLDTQSVSEEGDILVDEEGRLFSGVITERWLISYCGNQTSLGVVFMPDGRGGNYIAIAQLKQDS